MEGALAAADIVLAMTLGYTAIRVVTTPALVSQSREFVIAWLAATTGLALLGLLLWARGVMILRRLKE